MVLPTLEQHSLFDITLLMTRCILLASRSSRSSACHRLTPFRLLLRYRILSVCSRGLWQHWEFVLVANVIDRTDTCSRSQFLGPASQLDLVDRIIADMTFRIARGAIEFCSERAGNRTVLPAEKEHADNIMTFINVLQHDRYGSLH